jgi:hypothetical protein
MRDNRSRRRLRKYADLKDTAGLAAKDQVLLNNNSGYPARSAYAKNISRARRVVLKI